MSIIRIGLGENKKYSDGWDSIFGTSKPKEAKKKAPKAAAKKATPKKKKTAKKK